jgi:hypothetical protein
MHSPVTSFYFNNTSYTELVLELGGTLATVGLYCMIWEGEGRINDPQRSCKTLCRKRTGIRSVDRLRLIYIREYCRK